MPGDGVGHVVEHLPCQLLLDDDRVLEPDEDPADVEQRHPEVMHRALRPESDGELSKLPIRNVKRAIDG